MASPVRIGILGAAKIAPEALLVPAWDIPDVVVSAVAAREKRRALEFAEKQGIPKAFGSYEDLLQDAEIDAIYNALPISLHAEWSIRALEAGKHVLCEKPIANNEAEAKAMKEASERTGNILVEAFHYRHHPMAARLRGMLLGGSLGRIRSYEATFYVPYLPASNIQFDYALGGGATMDVGCYPISWVRLLSGEEPEVVSAKARLSGDQVDRYMEATLRFPSGAQGVIRCCIKAFKPLTASVRVIGDQGTMYAFNPLAPHEYNFITVKTAEGKTRETVAGATTYYYQLKAFADAVLYGSSVKPTLNDSVNNMRVIDAVYRAAGLKLRGT